MTISNKDTNNIIDCKLNKNAPIAFFDSGLGGLTVLQKLRELLPNEKFIYFGDTKNVPYGNKTKEELLGFSKNILKFFEEKGCKAVVMACNTTSSTIYEDIKDSYNFKIYPIVQSVAKILSQYNIERLGVFATKATVNSGVYEKEIAKYNKKISVYSQFCPQWVSIVENNELKNEQSYEIIKNDLDKMMTNNPQKIVLGCTHYPFLLGILSKFQDKDIFVDPAIPFAKFIKDDLIKNNLLSDANIANDEFYVSSNPQQFYTGAKFIYELKKEPELVIFDEKI